MIGRALAFVSALALAAAPCAAADLQLAEPGGERRSSAAAGVYFAVPFGGERSGRPRAGLRLRTTHEYRDAAARPVRSTSADTFELRLLGEQRPTLFVAERPVTGQDSRQNLFGGIVGTVVIGLAIVGAVVIYTAINDDEDEAVPN